jgi:Bacterial archaeo-eukaryotic release factor family 2
MERWRFTKGPVGYRQPMRTARLADLYQHRGPFASVTIQVDHANENGTHEHELRARAACEQLIDMGADGSAVQAVSERLGEQVNDPAPVSRTVVATVEGVIFDELLRIAVEQPVVTWGPLPEVSPWVERQDSIVPFVLAVVDHEGGDVAVHTSDVPDPEEESSVGGQAHRVHKVPTGGWSALRYQHVTENVWKRNAEAVAEAIVARVRSGLRLVLLAGDPRSRTEVMNALSGISAEVVQLDSGSRAADGGEEALESAVRAALFNHVAARRVQQSHKLQDRLGRGEAVATGVRDVADAFVRGQVETLLLDLRGAAELTLEPHDHPGLVVGAASVDEPVAADQALLALAALTGADVTISKRAALGGSPVAALLRWDQAAEGRP